jgi:hypothetical protein
MPSALWQFGSSPHPTIPSQGAVEKPAPDGKEDACSQVIDVLPAHDSSVPEIETIAQNAEESVQADLSIEKNDTRKEKKTKKKVTG